MEDSQGGLYDRDGNRIENPVPGNPHPNPEMPSDSERAEMEKWRNFGIKKRMGEILEWYDQNDAGNMPNYKDRDDDRGR